MTTRREPPLNTRDTAYALFPLPHELPPHNREMKGWDGRQRHEIMRTNDRDIRFARGCFVSLTRPRRAAWLNAN